MVIAVFHYTGLTLKWIKMSGIIFDKVLLLKLQGRKLNLLYDMINFFLCIAFTFLNFVLSSN